MLIKINNVVLQRLFFHASRARKSVLINPSLVKVAKEDDVISETGDPVSCRHFDDEGENIIDECVECFVHKRLPR